VIGATNRPDAVDPALRRPGRFDREFYFPLPNRDARKKIIGINTRKWDPQLSDETLDKLALLTKGYGGADLRVSIVTSFLEVCAETILGVVYGISSQRNSAAIPTNLQEHRQATA
jgi:SpoVK/Ycf46/Vps4 family AAA+-type ATPase